MSVNMQQMTSTQADVENTLTTNASLLHQVEESFTRNAAIISSNTEAMEARIAALQEKMERLK